MRESRALEREKRREHVVNFKLHELEREEVDVLVIGSGIAGLYTALKLSSLGQVLVLTKEKKREGSSDLAQGGIAAVFSKDDTPEQHLQDTMKAGAGLCNEEIVSLLVHDGPKRIKDLIAWGVPFDRDRGALSLAREGAHSRERVLHAGGDATGRKIQEVLERNALLSGIQVKEHSFAIDLLIAQGRAIGALYLDLKSGKLKAILAPVVILATGGLGRLYQYTSNPFVATGDGVAMAYRAGLSVLDMEFIQFHPTTLYRPGKESFLISEAVRGEGAFLRNGEGRRFMDQYHPLEELAPRDVVARAMFMEMKREFSSHLYLDLISMGREKIERRFPTIYRRCKEEGLDIASEWIPVRPAAHYAMGGVRVNRDGETGVEGLYACGEVASTGAHGANRLASNSLMEALVFGARVAQHVEGAFPSLKERYSFYNLEYSALKEGADHLEEDLEEMRHQINRIMEEELGIVRHGQGLLRALKELKGYRDSLDYMSLDAPFLELKNIVTVALLITRGAFRREESRGGHYRLDYPQTSSLWKRHLAQSLSSLAKEVVL